MSHTAAAKRLRVPGLRIGGGLGTRLTLILLPLVLLPVFALGAGAYQRARALLQESVIRQLESSAQAQTDTFGEWRRLHELRLWTVTQTIALQEPAGDLLSNADRPARLRLLRAQVTPQLEAINQGIPEGPYDGLMIVRLSDGLILGASPASWEGDTLRHIAEYPLSASVATSERPLSRATPISLVTVMPIPTGSDEPEVALVGLSSDVQIYSLIEQGMVAATPSSTVYLALPPGTLAEFDPLMHQLMLHPTEFHPVFQALQQDNQGDLGFVGFDNQPVIAAYRWMPDLSTAIMVEIPREIAETGLNALAGFFAALVAAATVMVVIVVPWVARRSVRPLATLSEMAERFARGDWEQRVPPGRHDEVGRLSATFNHMADDLQELYRSLEARVEQRTRQLRAASEVARDSAAIRDVDRLLDETVGLISERFGFYHAGIFLIDPSGERAVLRAASSEGGRRMLQRGHALEVGKVGIVGFVTGTGKGRVAHDVGADAVHFANPDLPLTRSEMALPLRAGARLIGALDVQSVEPSAFSEEDIVVLQTLADQLAVAIENASLIEVQTRLAAQRRRIIELYRQLMQHMAYAEVLARAPDLVRETFGYERATIALVEGGEVVVRSGSSTPGVRSIRLGQAVPRGQGILGRVVTHKTPLLIPDLAAELPAQQTLPPDTPRTILAVPLLTRGQAFGVLAVERLQPSSLTEEDRESLEMVAGVAAVALDNAKLFEQTQRSLQQVDALYRQQTEQAWVELLAARMTGAVKTSFEHVRKGRPSGAQAVEPGLKVPIALREEVIGWLELEAARSDQPWHEDDQVIVQEVADEVAAALEQARLMEEVHRRAAQLRTAAEIARDATSQLDLPTLLQRAIRLIRDRFGFSHVAVYLLDRSGQELTVGETAGQAAQELKAAGRRIRIDAPGIVSHAVSTAQAYLAHEVSSDSRYHPDPLLPDMQTELALPLTSAEQVIGVLDVQHTRAHSFTEDDVAVLQILADQLGVAIQNARSFEEAVGRARREQAVLEITSRIRSGRTVDEILQSAAQAMRQALGARHVAVRLAAQSGSGPEDNGGARSAGLPTEESA